MTPSWQTKCEEKMQIVEYHWRVPTEQLTCSESCVSMLSCLCLRWRRLTDNQTEVNPDIRRMKINSHCSAQRSQPTKVLDAGHYWYNFELQISSILPESINTTFGSVTYTLRALVERSSMVRRRLPSCQAIQIVRVPSDSSLEFSEPILVNRDWAEGLHYEIMIPSRAVTVGSLVPISLKLRPVENVRCHHVKAIITENIEYSCQDKSLLRLEPTREIVKLERPLNEESEAVPRKCTAVVPETSDPKPKTSDKTSPNDSNQAGCSTIETNIELPIQLPNCEAGQKRPRRRLHPDSTYANMQIHHWVKV